MIKNFLLLLLISSTMVLTNCQQKQTTISKTSEVNPPAEGFNLEASDPKAIEIADKVMKAMGGRAAYDSTRYISWNFFGARKHVWDKHTGDVHIESIRDDYSLDMNINDMTGSLKMAGEAVTHQDSLSKYLKKGKEMWINDSYWLVMPFKLKDSGVTLSYIGKDTIFGGAQADKLQMTFDGVGVTPQNKYHVYVEETSNLVKRWDFYASASDTTARFSTPWIGYKDYGGIMLGGDRGQYQVTDIIVSEDLKSYFEN